TNAFLARNNAAPACGAVLGLVARHDQRPDAQGAWATVISYQDVGYVPAASANGLAAPTLEADTRTARASQNRAFEGFAAPPGFDASNNSLSWAERTAPPGAGGKDMRFEQKLLGRRGVACLSSIGSADQLPAMQAAAGDLIHMISFTAGQA